MASTELLLKMSTRGAVVRMLNDENGTLFHGGTGGPLEISQPLSLGGLRTEVELTVRRQLTKSDNLPYPGQLAFRYNRLDVAGTLADQLNGFRPTMPSSTQVLLDELTSRTGIVFELEDFILEDIGRDNGAPYTLKAKPESLRWTGELQVMLLDLTNLATYIPPGLPPSPPTLQLTSPAVSSVNNQPYLNATPWRSALAGIALNEAVVTNAHPLYTLVANIVGVQGQYLRDSTNPWKVQSAATTYNLYGARLISRDEAATNVNPLIPATTRVARVRLGPQDTLYGVKDLLLPYANTSFQTSEFNDVPRLKASALISASNGTAWNSWLNSLTAPSIITALPQGMDLRISGPDRWVADPANPSPTNLYNAVVQYNGQRRSSDLEPYHSECNRVIVLTVSEANTAYQGNIIFHYRSPIVINDTPANAIYGSRYDFDLAPQEGVAPYTIQLVSGALAPGHSISPFHHIEGNTTTTGLYNAVIDVTDANGVKVRFNLSYRGVIGPIVVQGNPPVATRGVPYSFDFTVSGGRPEYTYRLITTAQGLTLPSPFVPHVEGTFTGEAGARVFALEVTDVVGTVYTHSFTVTVI
ncbi:hypothetical protein LUCX_293 [Xanthomonas phage vB_XciM_LucasX]|nr:hypothetical protein LUCX_293 [Xanthomonas phage vB_XciM_LucasX]